MQTYSESGTDLAQDNEVLDMTGDQFHLVVWNDEVNTFDWVIKALMDICGHEQEQAEQCTLIIHFKGKCTVKQGDYSELRTMCEAITDRGIGATVEEMAT
jgi:ATP-dependent Clp protease adaptor protein ClpS